MTKEAALIARLAVRVAFLNNYRRFTVFKGGEVMSKIDEAISETAYILDVLMAYRQIVNSGDCNICAIRRKCDYVPKPGELVRYNCPHYEAIEEVK